MADNKNVETTTYLLAIRFVGTAYHGSQIQSNAVTVQSVFQGALCSALGTLPDIKMCSRTDSGVHALEFCISFETSGCIREDKLVLALNSYLPADIRAISARKVPKGFHARYCSSGKQYIYRVYNSHIMDPFENGLAAQFIPHIDEIQLNEIAQVFVGKHDFRAFCSIKTDVESTVRTVTEYRVSRSDNVVEFSVSADGFLYNMARIMVGTLLNCARGKLGYKEIEHALKTGERSNLLATAPACGLYLAKVFYDETKLNLKVI